MTGNNCIAYHIGQELISIAESAHAFRRYDVLEQASDLMLALPLAHQFKSAGLYYRQLCIANLGQGDLEEAESLINLLIRSGAAEHSPRALMSLAAIYGHRQNRDYELDLYHEALRAAKSHGAFDPVTVVTATKMTAVWKATEASHKAAARDLECLMPLAKMVGRRSVRLF